MLETRTRRLHRRLAGADAMLDYPVLAEFRDLGLTEWLGLMLGFGWDTPHPETSQFGVVLSWATASIDGWSAVQLAALEELSATLALSVKSSAMPRATRDLLAAYLGGDAADR